jgi:hypothetical protein
VREGIGVRVGSGSGVGGMAVGVAVGVKVCVSVGGMNSVSVGVSDWIGVLALVPTGGGGRRVIVACVLRLGVSSAVGVGWTAMRTTAVQ